jgi:hypothetical protein
MTHFQTVRLKRGRHLSPEHGVCVMELASMLAGERFTDHPGTVSPVIAAFLRAYNDLVDDARRQDLYSYASECVGTRSSRQLEARRVEACRDWLDERMSLARRVRWIAMFGLAGRRQEVIAGQAASHAAASSSRHAEALALLDLLIAIGSTPDQRLTSLKKVLSSPEAFCSW